MRTWVLACAAVAQVAMADPVPQAPPTCEAASPHEASALADRLFEKGEYQRAGACYQAAGDMVHANLSFLQAVGPQSEDTARGLKAQREAAKSLLTSVQHAFHSSH
jgi:hypothetical protein